jgi:hypothetical protein
MINISIDKICINNFERLISPIKPKSKIGYIQYCNKYLQVFAARILFLGLNLLLIKEFRWENNNSLFEHLNSDFLMHKTGLTHSEYEVRKRLFEQLSENRLTDVDQKAHEQFKKRFANADPAHLTPDDVALLRSNYLPQVLKNLKSMIDKGQLEAIRYCLSFREDVLKILLNQNGKSDGLFMHAAKAKQWNIVELLFEKKELLDDTCFDQEGNTPLHYAIREQQEDIASLFIEHNLWINAVNQKKESPLWIALHKGFDDLALKLMLAGANLLEEDERGKIPYMWICQNKPKNFIKKLFLFDSNRFKGYPEPLAAVCMQNRWDIALELINEGANVKISSPTPLSSARMAFEHQIMKTLNPLDNGYTDWLERCEQLIRRFGLKIFCSTLCVASSVKKIMIPN